MKLSPSLYVALGSEVLEIIYIWESIGKNATLPPECAIDLAVTSKRMSNFIACHRGLSCVHVMYHSSNTNARQTPGTSMVLIIIKMRFVVEIKFSPVPICHI